MRLSEKRKNKIRKIIHRGIMHVRMKDEVINAGSKVDVAIAQLEIPLTRKILEALEERAQ